MFHPRHYTSVATVRRQVAVQHKAHVISAGRSSVWLNQAYTITVTAGYVKINN
jgi:hypothetical protein